MSDFTESLVSDVEKLNQLKSKLEKAILAYESSPSFAKAGKVSTIFDLSKRIFNIENGFSLIESQVKKLEEIGVFKNSDYDFPQILLPALSANALKSSDVNVVIMESLSLLRLLAVSKGDFTHSKISAEQSHNFLTQVMAINLQGLFIPPSEAEREQQGRLVETRRNLLKYLADRIGYEHIVDQLIDEIWRILKQRPVQVDNVKQMINQIAICRQSPDVDMGNSGQGADRLISSLYGLTEACREDPGVGVYQERLFSMDFSALQYEANGFARAMHDTGLVSPYHGVLLRHLELYHDSLLATALGLSSTGRDCLLSYKDLIKTLISEVIFPETSQAVYGLSLMLERGILYQSPIGPALWRQLSLNLSEKTVEKLRGIFGEEISPKAKLLEGVLCILGQPLGVGQGNNPTCQSARAISMWSYNDPDYLLQLIVWAARDDEIIMHFEGQTISSKQTGLGIAKEIPVDLDPVSLILVPHLDRIYAEMGRLCVSREGDPHRWVNPEFHGWSCGRGFNINVDVKTGKLVDLDKFLRHFYASYHPYYNGNQPIIHPQPAGIAVTDSVCRFVGWHAITLLRVALDPQNVMRVYFYNPNNDSGQNWGDEVLVSTSGNSERFGEASLPFEQFASRLYIFHYDPLERGDFSRVDQSLIDEVIEKIHRSWGMDRT